MDIKPQDQEEAQPISDDQELAKVLAGVTRNTDNNLNFGETPTTPISAPVPTPEPVIEPEPTTDISTEPVANSNDLESVKKDALIELRPLVDKLNLSPDEKFDIYLLLIRSTDDKTLIAPAHDVARGITDESKRAQALLDIIKEIDYLSNPPQANA